MSRTPWTYVGLALLAVGLVASGVGAATHLEEKRCETAAFVQVLDTDAVNGSLDGYDRVAYGNLSTAERRTFREVRDAGGQALAAKGSLPEAVVAYGNDSYVVRYSAESGCTPWDRERVVTPLAAGLGGVVVGLGLTRGLDP
ncbi:hypothetical protein [Halosegnis marinus]|uniref:Uncharacterized protein n=1 Tax=Halosegnis marinus TaxID=3034023 RepID=A0ABD5ZLJ1_9EURY|nr:hypothetical protein [Halosegnis sp. DT85]